MIKYNDLRAKLLADQEVKEEYEKQKLESFNDELNYFLNSQLKGEKIAYNEKFIAKLTKGISNVINKYDFGSTFECKIFQDKNPTTGEINICIYPYSISAEIDDMTDDEKPSRELKKTLNWQAYK